MGKIFLLAPWGCFNSHYFSQTSSRWGEWRL